MAGSNSKLVSPSQRKAADSRKARALLTGWGYEPSQGAIKEVSQALSEAREQGLLEALGDAENPANVSMVGGSTGDAHGTAKRIAQAIRSRIPEPKNQEDKNSDNTKHDAG